MLIVSIFSFLIFLRGVLTIALKNENYLEKIQGVYNDSIIYNTPPTQTQMRWYLGVLNDLDSIKGCEGKNQICGITEVKIPNSNNTIVTEVIKVRENSKTTINDNLKTTPKKDTKVKHYDNIEWGGRNVSIEIKYLCNLDLKNVPGVLKYKRWDRKKLKLRFESSRLCAGKKISKAKISSFRKFFIILLIVTGMILLMETWAFFFKGNYISPLGLLTIFFELVVIGAKILSSFIMLVISLIFEKRSRQGYVLIL